MIGRRSERGCAPMPSRFVAVAGLAAIMVSGCGDEEAIAAEPLEVMLDGVAVDCTHDLVIPIARADAHLQVENAIGSVRVSQDGRDVTAAFGSGEALTMPVGARTRIELLDDRNSGCAFFALRSDGIARALDALAANSVDRFAVVASPSTGAPAVVFLNVPLAEGDRAGETRAFLQSHGGALGIERSNLAVQSVRTLADAHTRVTLAQWIDGVRVLEATVEAELEDARVVRIDSSLLPDGEVEAFAHSPLEVAAVAEALAGSSDVEPVYFDGPSNGVADARLRAGWYAAGPQREVLLADADLAPVVDRDRLREVSRVELHAARFNGSNFRSIRGHWAYASGDSNVVRPTIHDPNSNESGDDVLWTMLARAANYYEDAHSARWAARTIDATYGSVMGLRAGTVRAIVASSVIPVAYDPATRFLLLNRTSRDVKQQDVVCHEFAHAIDEESGGLYWAAPIAEAVADVGAAYCEARIHSGARRWVLGDSTHVRDFASGIYRGEPGITHYDSFSGTAQGLDAVPALYRPTFLITRALARAVDVHGMSFRAGEDVAYASLGWSVRTFPDFREQWIATMHDWARSGSHDVTHADVCAMARGFRDTGLDGDYRPSSERPQANTTGQFVCTNASCPLCDCVSAGTCDGLTRPPMPTGCVSDVTGQRSEAWRSGASTTDRRYRGLVRSSTCAAGLDCLCTVNGWSCTDARCSAPAEPPREMVRSCRDDVFDRDIALESHGYLRQGASPCPGTPAGSGIYACNCRCTGNGFALCGQPARIDLDGGSGGGTPAGTAARGCAVGGDPSPAPLVWSLIALGAACWRRRSGQRSTGR